MSHSFDSRHFLKTVPRKPGVYVMYDIEKNCLYVGKARNLKNRVGSYFRGSGLATRTMTMVSRIADVQLTVTHTEGEALLLENNLIKSLRPRYNIDLKDDKSYPYIRLTSNQAFPRLHFYRGNRKQAGEYFGPFPSAAAVRETLAMLQKVIPVRQCEDTFYRNRSRPCLQYQIKRCTAPCVDLVRAVDYAEDVRQARLFLTGKDQGLIEQLVQQMDQTSKALEFEKSARIRDRISSLQRVQEKQYIEGGETSCDVVALAREDDHACVHLAFVRYGRNIGSTVFFPRVNLEADDADIMYTFLSRHYLEREVPVEILVSIAPADQQLLRSVMADRSGHKVVINSAQRSYRRRWVEMGKINAEDQLRRRLADKASMAKRFEALRSAFCLPETPQRIECFDISHTSGERTVASCVVFNNDGPLKTDYRRFNIGNITPGDDYAAMEQVVMRRYQKLKENDGVLPDLVLIDGGRGQLEKATEVFRELQIEDVLLVGVAKGEGRKAGLEKLLLSGHKAATILEPTSPALHLIQQIRDEAHRFAITGHRARRQKARRQSSLEQIPGIGEKRRQALIKYFGGLQEIRRAGVEDLDRVPGISLALARKIYGFFNS